MQRPRTLRIPEPLERELEREFAVRGTREWSSGVVELLGEAVRMRRVPGIGFVDSLIGRRAVLAGTAHEIWEIIATWRDVGQDEEQLRQSYSWLSPVQLRSALAYYKLYPDEINAQLDLENSWNEVSMREYLRPFATLGPGLEDSED